jgi:hypothetical protein
MIEGKKKKKKRKEANTTLRHTIFVTTNPPFEIAQKGVIDAFWVENNSSENKNARAKKREDRLWGVICL